MPLPIDQSDAKSHVSENLSARVYSQIKDLILCSEVRPGQKLNHQELSDRLGVSRTPVREALTRLVQEGYVTFLPNRGFTCKEIGMQEAEELYDLREALEAFAVEKAIENLSDSALQRLRARIISYGEDLDRRFTRERLVYDQEIHLAIVQLAGNEMLKNMLHHVFERIILKRRTDGLYDLTRGVVAHQEHLRLFAAIERRDIGAAVHLVRAHIQEGKRNVLLDLKQRRTNREIRLDTILQQDS